MLIRILLLTLLALCVIVGLAIWVGMRRWQRATAAFNASLDATLQSSCTTVYSATELERLPVPVARYLRLVLRDGQPTIRRTRIEWRGGFNMGPPGADNWKPLQAKQTYVVDPTGVFWSARVAMAPLLPALVRDMFLSGQGSMRGKIAGLITVVDCRPPFRQRQEHAIAAPVACAGDGLARVRRHEASRASGGRVGARQRNAFVLARHAGDGPFRLGAGMTHRRVLRSPPRVDGGQCRPEAIWQP